MRKATIPDLREKTLLDSFFDCSNPALSTKDEDDPELCHFSSKEIDQLIMHMIEKN